MTSIDYVARRDKVAAAIDDLLTGKASAVTLDDGTSVTKLDLDWLQKYETQLNARIQRARRSRGAFRVGAPR